MKWQIFSLPLLLVTTGLLVFTNTSLAAPAEADDGLGRVFNTPQKRAILDQLRQRNARITPDQKVDTFALNGIVLALLRCSNRLGKRNSLPRQLPRCSAGNALRTYVCWERKDGGVESRGGN